MNKIDSRFIVACQKGEIENIKYCLTSPKLKKHANINVLKDDGFRYACYFGHLDVVKYLLSSQDLKVHANIDARDNSGLFVACSEGHLNIIRYLLFDINLKIDSALDIKFKTELDHEKYEIFKDLLNKRDLFFKLNESLISRNKNVKIKI